MEPLWIWIPSSRQMGAYCWQYICYIVIIVLILTAHSGLSIYLANFIWYSRLSGSVNSTIAGTQYPEYLVWPFFLVYICRLSLVEEEFQMALSQKLILILLKWSKSVLAIIYGMSLFTECWQLKMIFVHVIIVIKHLAFVWPRHNCVYWTGATWSWDGKIERWEIARKVWLLWHDPRHDINTTVRGWHWHMKYCPHIAVAWPDCCLLWKLS